MMNVKIPILTQSHAYDVYIGALQDLSFAKKYSKILILSNEKVAPLYLERIKAHLPASIPLASLILPDGEMHKNFKTVQKIIDFASKQRLDRKSLMIALGGGVISDITGFVSGIYQRGVDFVNVPTTLLAQVDASVGGKTGINTSFGKNLVGLFHQPAGVFVYPEFLSTLPPREFASGIAEMIKIGVCFDRGYFAFLENYDLIDPKILSQAIARAIALKADVVAKDEKEQGIRAGLNYGHTFGHVIELETGYQKYLHGEAVAMGMQMANVLAYELGWLSLNECARISSVLEKYHLLLKYQVRDLEAFYQKFFLDKKTTQDVLHFVLPRGIGAMEICKNISKEQLFKVLGVFS